MAALDPERVREHIAGGTFDLRAVANFVLDMMAKMCAPARDEQVAALRQIHEIVPLFKCAELMLLIEFKFCYLVILQNVLVLYMCQPLCS